MKALPSIAERPWALEPGALRELAQFLAAGGDGRSVLERTRQPAQKAASLAVLPLHGVIDRRGSLIGDLLGGTSIEQFRAELRAAVDDASVRGIVVSVDSPGGSVAGVTELAAEIRAARDKKPVYAVADTTAASAAFWLGAQATRLYVTPSGQVGSVGVYAVHFDVSRALEAAGVTPTIISSGSEKVEGNEYEPLSDTARTEMQRRVDAFAAQFVGDVAKGRGVSPESVRARYGQGRMLLARDALAAGMVDGIATLDQVAAEMAGDIRRADARKAAPAARGPRFASREAWLDYLSRSVA